MNKIVFIFTFIVLTSSSFILSEYSFDVDIKNSNLLPFKDTTTLQSRKLANVVSESIAARIHTNCESWMEVPKDTLDFYFKDSSCRDEIQKHKVYLYGEHHTSKVDDEINGQMMYGSSDDDFFHFKEGSLFIDSKGVSNGTNGLVDPGSYISQYIGLLMILESPKYYWNLFGAEHLLSSICESGTEFDQSVDLHKKFLNFNKVQALHAKIRLSNYCITGENRQAINNFLLSNIESLRPVLHTYLESIESKIFMNFRGIDRDFAKIHSIQEMREMEWAKNLLRSSCQSKLASTFFVSVGAGHTSSLACLMKSLVQNDPVEIIELNRVEDNKCYNKEFDDYITEQKVVVEEALKLLAVDEYSFFKPEMQSLSVSITVRDTKDFKSIFKSNYVNEFKMPVKDIINLGNGRYHILFEIPPSMTLSFLSSADCD
jgi:hypothetical protein